MAKILDKLHLTYDDVFLIPQKGVADSRFNGSISLSTELLPELTLEYPIISANMDTITELEMAKAMVELGGLGIIHRFLDLQEITFLLKHLCRMSWRPVACVGVDTSLDDLLEALEGRLGGVLVDVAHGHSNAALARVEMLDKKFKGALPIIAGNVATGTGALELARAGASCIKVGVGPGSVCTTRVQTGNGVPQLSAIMDVYEALQRNNLDTTIIADGGIKSSGDIAKALAAGADAVMIGGLFAGTKETPGERINKGTEKVYRGLASRQAQLDRKGEARSVEGETMTVPYRGSVRDIFEDLVEGIKSAMSYQGASSLAELRENAVFGRQTAAGYYEGTPHGLNRYGR
jgi:IMP dehydrogenase/GMP reductase